MDGIIGSVVAIALSFGYTEMKMRKHQKEYQTLKDRVESLEQDLGTKMLGAMMPISKSIKELQVFTGIR